MTGAQMSDRFFSFFFVSVFCNFILLSKLGAITLHQSRFQVQPGTSHQSGESSLPKRGMNTRNLEALFLKSFKGDKSFPHYYDLLKTKSFQLKGQSVPTLVKVMKSEKFPIENRWSATMILAQVMGTKSAPFIAKFTKHSHWMMRVAALKALLGLKQRKYASVYAEALKDPSLIVRMQSLENISQLNLKSLAPQVWKMMFDKSNYSGKTGSRKRTAIIKQVIKTIGDIKFKKAQKSLAMLIQKKNYSDLFHSLDQSLKKITGVNSPESMQEKRVFWAKRVSLR